MRKSMVLKRMHWFLTSQCGIDIGKMHRSLRGFPRYLRDYAKFRKTYSGPVEFTPCLHDWWEEGGVTRGEYFWQDLLVARMIFGANPDRHVDVGSRIDGFVAHVASFREIEVFDVRPITAKIPGVTFITADLMNPVDGLTEYCDSLSCLHALEHFGLGRYGDPIDPGGFARGLASMAAMLKYGGVFYLSLPIGTARVEFNANRISDPRSVVAEAAKHSLVLVSLAVIHGDAKLETIAIDEAQLTGLAQIRYALGMFKFEKRER